MKIPQNTFCIHVFIIRILTRYKWLYIAHCKWITWVDLSTFRGAFCRLEGNLLCSPSPPPHSLSLHLPSFPPLLFLIHISAPPVRQPLKKGRSALQSGAVTMGGGAWKRWLTEGSEGSTDKSAGRDIGIKFSALCRMSGMMSSASVMAFPPRLLCALVMFSFPLKKLIY